jgi:hypothetical protein
MRASQSTDARFVALLALGALALHQLRYALAHGADASAALEREGHAYLELAIGPVLTLALAAIVVSLIRRAWTPARLSAPSPLRMFAANTVALLAVFSVQELAEGFLFAGHASGLAAILGGGGWLALPLAAAIGALLTAASLLLSRADGVLAELIENARSLGRAPRATRRTGTALPAHGPDFVLCFGFARRPPPVAAS